MWWEWEMECVWGLGVEARVEWSGFDGNRVAVDAVPFAKGVFLVDAMRRDDG